MSPGCSASMRARGVSQANPIWRCLGQGVPCLGLAPLDAMNVDTWQRSAVAALLARYHRTTLVSTSGDAPAVERLVMRRRWFTLFSVGLFIGATFLISAAPAAADGTSRGHVRVLLSGLNSPKALALFNSRTLAIGQGAYGPPDPALLYVFKGAGKGTTTPLTDPVNIVDAVITPDRAGWAIGGDRVLYR